MISAALLLLCSAFTQPGTLDAVWPGEVEYIDAPLAIIELAVDPDADAQYLVPFSVVVRAERDLGEIPVRMSVFDADGEVVESGEVTIDVAEGPNRCRFQWDARDNPPGHYTAVIEARYLPTAAPAMAMVALRRVTRDALAQAVEQAQQALTDLRARTVSARTEAGLSTAYLDMRLTLASKVRAQADAALRRNEWRNAALLADYLERAVQRTRATLTWDLDGQDPRYAEAPAPLPAGISVAGERLLNEGMPTFLIGAVLDTPDPQAVESLSRLGFNMVSVQAPASAVAGQPAQHLGALLDTAAAEGMAVHVDLAAETLAANLATAEARAALREHIRAVTPFLARQAPVFSVSLAQNPQLSYTPTQFQDAFIDYVEVLYEDRYALNRSWRAHLGGFDEITLAPEEAPVYQTRRAFQWDYQEFLRTLVHGWFDAALTGMDQTAPNLARQVDLPATAFDEGESHRGIRRATLTPKTEISGLVGPLRQDHPYYGYNYPVNEVHYALLDDIAPGHPIFNVAMSTDVTADEGARLFEVMHTATWQAFITGADAVAVPRTDAAFALPDALEGYATAALDLRRLTPVVRAFQDDRAPIAVLWSYTSKVFDNGEPYLSSAFDAFEGLSFGGYKVRWVSEEQVAAGALKNVRLLVIPETPALTDAAFKEVQAYVDAGRAVARIGSPIPYDPRGQSRLELIVNTPQTVLVRGLNLPTEYLHAVDAAVVEGALPEVPRAVNASGYPIEGVITRFVRHDGRPYLYAVNLRQDPVLVEITGGRQGGHDLIRGGHVTFPREMPPLQPVLLAMDTIEAEVTLQAARPTTKRAPLSESRR